MGISWKYDGNIELDYPAWQWLTGNRTFTSVFADRPSFRAKGLLRHKSNRNFTSVFTIDPHFVRKGWRFVTLRRHHPRPKERKIKKARERKRREKGEKMWRWEDVREGVKMSRCEDGQMWEKMWRWADVKMSRCERRCEDEQMWRCADVWEKKRRCERRCKRRCEDEQMWRWADVKMSRCERRCERRYEDEQMWDKIWRWADVTMSRCERRCEDEQMWRWADVKMSRCERRCEDEQMSRCESRCERRCEDEQMWKWEGVREGVKMRRCEDEKVWRWEGVKMRRCEDEKVWRWEDEIQTPTIGRTLRSDALGKNPLFVDDVDDWFGVIRLYYPILGMMIIIYEMGHPFLSSQYLSGRDSPGDWWLIMMATPIREIHEISTIGLLVFYFYDPTIYSSKEKLSSVSHF